METQVSPSKIGIRYGIITGIIFIIYGLILQMTGLIANQALGWVSYIILFILIFMAHNSFKSGGDGFMKFGQGVTIGFVISLVSGVLSSIFTFIYVKYVDDSMIQMAMDKALQDMEEKNMSDEEIEMAMSWTEKFLTPVMFLIIGIVFTVIFGLIISLIVSAITKKDNPQAAA